MAIHIQLKEGANSTTYWGTTAPVEIVEDLSTELDNGSFTYLRTEQDSTELTAPLSSFVIEVDPSDEDTTGGEIPPNRQTYSFVGFDSCALLRRDSTTRGMYKHSVTLVEPSKLLQGVMIDGFGVTQPEDETKRKTLLDVLQRLLLVTPFDNAQSNAGAFKLTTDSKVTNVLTSIKSPEFKWNTQTTLWECLVQIGAVIDAMPHLVADAQGNYTVITFDFVNASNNEVQIIDDAVTNAIGENVEEGQYNSALCTVVENLLES